MRLADAVRTIEQQPLVDDRKRVDERRRLAPAPRAASPCRARRSSSSARRSAAGCAPRSAAAPTSVVAPAVAADDALDAVDVDGLPARVVADRAHVMARRRSQRVSKRSDASVQIAAQVLAAAQLLHRARTSIWRMRSREQAQPIADLLQASTARRRAGRSAAASPGAPWGRARPSRRLELRDQRVARRDRRRSRASPDRGSASAELDAVARRRRACRRDRSATTSSPCRRIIAVGVFLGDLELRRQSPACVGTCSSCACSAATCRPKRAAAPETLAGSEYARAESDSRCMMLCRTHHTA